MTCPDTVSKGTCQGSMLLGRYTRHTMSLISSLSLSDDRGALFQQGMGIVVVEVGLKVRYLSVFLACHFVCTLTFASKALRNNEMIKNSCHDVNNQVEARDEQRTVHCYGFHRAIKQVVPREVEPECVIRAATASAATRAASALPTVILV